MSLRLGIITTHPVQYHAPWFRELARRYDLQVLYAHRQTEKGQAEAGFGVEFAWDIPLLEGYRYRWLRNVAKNPGLGRFGGCDTPELYSLIVRNRFDAVLVFGWAYKSALQATIAAWRNGVPVLMRGDSELLSHRPWWKRALKAAGYPRLLPRFDAHLYVGQRNREYLARYGVPESRLFFSPHFVDNRFFQEAAEKARAERRRDSIRGELEIPADAFVPMFVGKFIAQKRPQDFVVACRALIESSDFDVYPLLVGDGPMGDSLKSAAGNTRERFRFVGFQNQSRMPEWYTTADVVALPSGDETWGLVVNEAMACDLPAVVSDAVGCSPDLIDNGRTGFIYRMGDTLELAHRLITLAAMPESSWVWAVRRKVEDYSMGKATVGLEDALQAVMSE